MTFFQRFKSNLAPVILALIMVKLAMLVVFFVLAAVVLLIAGKAMAAVMLVLSVVCVTLFITLWQHFSLAEKLKKAGLWV